jgi:arylsulfatase A-like enzyme
MHVDPERAQTIASRLQDAGYRTGAFRGHRRARRNARACARAFDVYDDLVDPPCAAPSAWRCVHALQSLLPSSCPCCASTGARTGSRTSSARATRCSRAQAWIQADDPRPWFCFVNLYDAHWPYLPEGEGRARLVRPYDGPVDGFLFRSDAWQAGYQLQSADKQHVSDLYEGEIFDLDAEVARFLGHLELQRGGTAVLVTADHGEALGEAEAWNHDDVREPQTRVPLLLRLPQPNPRAERVRAPVSGVDVAPTLLALAGIEPPPGMEGANLLRPAGGTERERWVDDRDHLRPEEYRCALYRGAYKLVRFGSGPAARYELYDLGRRAGRAHGRAGRAPAAPGRARRAHAGAREHGRARRGRRRAGCGRRRAPGAGLRGRQALSGSRAEVRRRRARAGASRPNASRACLS